MNYFFKILLELRGFTLQQRNSLFDFLVDVFRFVVLQLETPELRERLPLVRNPLVSLTGEALVDIRLFAVELDPILLHQVYQKVYVVPHVVTFEDVLLVGFGSDLVERLPAVSSGLTSPGRRRSTWTPCLRSSLGLLL